MNVLVSSAGTASAIGVIKSLRLQTELPVRLLAVDSDATAPGLYLADEHFLIPPCSHADYIPHLLELCRRHEVRAFFPIHSAEIAIVAEHAAKFQTQSVGVLLPGAETVRRCNDKTAMYQLARTLGIPTPENFDPAAAKISFPLFAKPNTGSGSAGAFRIDYETDLAYARARHPGFLIQEFVAGAEYTVDVLCDRHSRMVVASPRLRLATKAGQSVKGRTVQAPELVKLCEQLCRAAGMVGPGNLQFIERAGQFVFVELNPRYPAGGLMLTVHAGANLPLLALKLMLGQPVVAPTVRSGVTMLRYWEEIIRA